MNAKEWIKSTIRGFMCVSGILGNNWLGFCSLPKSRSQLRTNNILFINLAISNLITNYMVDLPDTLELVKRWPVGRMYCSAFNFFSDLSETSSIFTTMFITVFWHQKLVGSLKHGGAPVQMDNTRLVMALLAGSWTVSVVFSLPHLFFTSLNIQNQSSEECLEYFPSQEVKQTYEMVFLMLANVVPIVGIVFASIQITVTLLQSQKRIKNISSRAGPRGDDQRKAASNELSSKDYISNATSANAPNTIQKVQKSQDRSNSSSGSSQVRAAKSVVAVATVFVICWLTHLLLSITSTIHDSIVIHEMTSYIGALYTCIIPYIYLYGVKKLTCLTCSSID
ncbi:tachykinin-like peptides receptor 86C [Astyanax mexicanus]|uniref:Tachykinin-like peptides receptor 86C n=1 Tax=Astyanax mexicanus TaxID=7994 RepID=A0A8T2KVZ6_ASTMX|nr:tachykinin-like peptides receptor 86C [Astyanax mexicanus]